MSTPKKWRLMVQGTTSNAGKSILVAGLCRVLSRCGQKVAPFKPQNMALNSAVTLDGGEIGRAQSLQAQAANVAPSVLMNPVLLKPISDRQSQVIVLGQVVPMKKSIGYGEYKRQLMPTVLSAFETLCAQFDVVIVEGAGSPAEINLRENDIANMGFAEAADVPVILIADIDRGGVFAHLYGTLALLSPSEQARVKGFVINRFRGDLSLLQSGLDWLEEKTGKPVLGVLPYLMDLRLDEEDAVVTQQTVHSASALKVGVFVYPHMSNHSDFDPLLVHPDVEVIYVRMGDAIPTVDLWILPGTKQVCDDLAFFRQQGWDCVLQRHLRYGGKVMGICGGYQMLGQFIDDPQQVEGALERVNGLGYLPITTQFFPQKTLKQQRGVLHLPNRSPVPIEGYEIHAGQSQGMQDSPLTLGSVREGCLSQDNQIVGTYLHGLFDSPLACREWLLWAGKEDAMFSDWQKVREQNLDKVADMLEAHLDLERLFQET